MKTTTHKHARDQVVLARLSQRMFSADYNDGSDAKTLACRNKLTLEHVIDALDALVKVRVKKAKPKKKRRGGR